MLTFATKLTTSAGDRRSPENRGFRWLLVALTPLASFACVTTAVGAESPRHGVALPEYAEHRDLAYFLTEDGKKRPIKTRSDWRQRRQHILGHVQRVMGEFPRPSVATPLDVEILEETTLGRHIRRKIAYHTDSPDARVTAWLFVPAAAARKSCPAVLCLHQTVAIGKDEPAGLGGNPNLHYAAELAERGYVTLAPDYPSFGDYRYDFDGDDYVSGSMKAIYDNSRAVDLLQAMPEVDPERVGCMGHSLGGHNAIFTAAFEPRIKAIVSSCGFTQFPKYYGGDLAGWASPRYMPRIAKEYANDPHRVPFDFSELIAALAPRPFLAVAPLKDDNFDNEGVRIVMAAAEPVYRLYDRLEHLAADYPDVGHDFPRNSRRRAYEFFDRHFDHQPNDLP